MQNDSDLIADLITLIDDVEMAEFYANKAGIAAGLTAGLTELHGALQGLAPLMRSQEDVDTMLKHITAPLEDVKSSCMQGNESAADSHIGKAQEKVRLVQSALQKN